MPLTKCPWLWSVPTIQSKSCLVIDSSYCVFQRGRKKCEFNSTLIRALRQRQPFLDLTQQQFVVQSSLSHLPCLPPSHSTASRIMPRPAHYTPSMISAVRRRRQTRHRGGKNKKQVTGKTSKFMHWLFSIWDSVIYSEWCSGPVGAQSSLVWPLRWTLFPLHVAWRLFCECWLISVSCCWTEDQFTTFNMTFAVAQTFSIGWTS